MKKNELARALDNARYRITREVHENPLTCLGLALGAGIVVGALGAHSASRHRSALEELVAGLGDHLGDARDRVSDLGSRATDELRSATHQAASAAQDIDLEKIIRRGRRWLRAMTR